VLIDEATLPDRELRPEPMRKSAFDEADYAFHRLGPRRKQKMDVIGHDHERMQLVMPLATIVLQRFQKHLGVCGDLKESAAIRCGRGDKESTSACGTGRNGHRERIICFVPARGCIS
jgi:hypothetical protein